MVKPKAFIEEEAREAYEIARRFKRRDFSGNTGKVVKNSFWQISTTLTAKIGSLLFTIIIARLMAPELYGLYGLALSTLLFIGIFSEPGINAALSTFISKTIDKRPGKAKGYFYLLTKYKIFFIVLSSFVILLTASWFSSSYYNKPIYYALLVGAIYIPMLALSSYLAPIFTSKNDFYPQFIKELIVQVSRLTIIPLFIIYFLSKVSSTEFYLFSIMILLSLCLFAGTIYLMIMVKLRHPFKQQKAKLLNKKEKHDLFRFILPLSVTALSGVVFGYIDQIMLGAYVQSQFLGFYQAAFNLVASASGIIAFSAAAVFPIFARLKGKQLERGFKKIRNMTLLISISAALFTFIIAPIIIQLIYGSDYSTAIIYLRILSVLLISFPLIGLYSTYYTSQGRTKVISVLLVSSTVLNVALNYVLISIGLQYSMSYAVIGACLATVISRYMYLFGLIIARRR